MAGFRIWYSIKGDLFCAPNLHHEYVYRQPTDLDGVPIASILDVAAMKLIALSQRGLKRDFFDLYSILQDTPFPKVAEHACRRYGVARINPFVIGKAMVYFADAEVEPEPTFPSGKKIPWKKVRIYFEKHARQFVLDLETNRTGP